MILYHGSYAAITKPDLSFARLKTDFGSGFHTTPIREQAVNWSKHFLREGKPAVVSAYAFLEKAGEDISRFKVLEFNTHSKKWLDFIMANRLGQPVGERWDLVIGGVANDKVFNTLELYFKGELTSAQAIRRLRYNKPNFQYCFKNQVLINDYLHFAGAEDVK
ncbi:MAG: DUF3990 domain-containing protein [Methylobacteriaceae bacterium]|jgi:hypothetical protein|nr:DUF3990 domain-containing protein [Methylobacteriaceae bacterium]